MRIPRLSPDNLEIINPFSLSKQGLASGILLPWPLGGPSFRGSCLADPARLLRINLSVILLAVLLYSGNATGNIAAFFFIVFRQIHNTLKTVVLYR